MTGPGWAVLGTLRAVPALDRPDLLGEPVAHALKALDARDAAFVGVAEIDPGLADTAAFCAAYSSPVESAGGRLPRGRMLPACGPAPAGPSCVPGAGAFAPGGRG